ncbi:MULTISPECIES: oxidoreductase-like domain-containing protein [Xanthomonas]|uniref:Oxidoreductase-like domain-containing protein n=1 Tax=Xanthomonas cucurbitae TaxID=56453 RepID=A0A2S7DWA7_9XANT|nr:oxidoreductase-like domain-containing protein [Xanthomonas cucurbitae]PPU78114.1 oxidoreductase-like protein [Xanthomonas cucurbitae]QHG86570.1 oxidoreductase-like protein [Xanthomonas cucurbitae]WDM68825.1 oxidoreductase-like domain-containing protein [Xanthomonas cucurbitae]WDM72697.1 oxidoreductase-like domain-containing protein [Xanthomonas cucurbitae]WDM76483.1 oxidoreductase-like domain-containing protein [Xanthomonas cucurbitae]
MHDHAVSATDPRPQPPQAPAPNECCESGCPLCVHDLYAEELGRYRQALAAWETRQQARAR